MEAILFHADLWNLVTGDEIWEADEKDPKELKDFRKRQAACKVEMVLKLDDSQLVHMNNTDPKIVWESLAKVHCTHTFTSCLHASSVLLWKAGLEKYESTPLIVLKASKSSLKE